MSRLLTSSQATAIHLILMTLKKADARMGRIVFPTTSVVVRQDFNGNIVVVNMADPTYPAETWIDTSAFTEAYKLS